MQSRRAGIAVECPNDVVYSIEREARVAPGNRGQQARDRIIVLTISY